MFLVRKRRQNNIHPINASIATNTIAETFGMMKDIYGGMLFTSIHFMILVINTIPSIEEMVPINENE